MNTIRIYHWISGVKDILGPGNRAVVWVQGCSLRCEGCIAPEMWSTEGGVEYQIQELASKILENNIDGLTVSGGEPTEQSAAVSILLEQMKVAGKNTWVYSGHTLEALQERRDPMTERLLSFTDVLVDGRFDIKQADSLLFRGSTNQRIHYLTDAVNMSTLVDKSRIEVSITDSGKLLIVGVPPPDFLRKFQAKLRDRGIVVSPETSWEGIR